MQIRIACGAVSVAAVIGSTPYEDSPLIGAIGGTQADGDPTWDVLTQWFNTFEAAAVLRAAGSTSTLAPTPVPSTVAPVAQKRHRPVTQVGHSPYVWQKSERRRTSRYESTTVQKLWDRPMKRRQGGVQPTDIEESGLVDRPRPNIRITPDADDEGEPCFGTGSSESGAIAFTTIQLPAGEAGDPKSTLSMSLCSRIGAMALLAGNPDITEKAFLSAMAAFQIPKSLLKIFRNDQVQMTWMLPHIHLGLIKGRERATSSGPEELEAHSRDVQGARHSEVWMKYCIEPLKVMEEGGEPPCKRSGFFIILSLNQRKQLFTDLLNELRAARSGASPSNRSADGTSSVSTVRDP